MRNKLVLVMSIAIMIGGAVMIYLPWSERHQHDRQMESLQAEFLDVQETLSEATAVDEHARAYILEQRAYICLVRDYALAKAKDPDKAEREARRERVAEVAAGWQVDGILNIERIDLSMPIIHDAEMAHLNVSPSSIKDTPKPWQGGNYVIAGHRSTVPGRHFNRLGELKENDLINFVDREKNYYFYRIYDIRVVHESEISLLENTEMSQITLITCDPLGVRHPDTRLIVRARLLDS